jgi:glycosyltransferase involved in cell wall biosynthesis
LTQRCEQVEIVIVDDGSETPNPNVESYGREGIKYVFQNNSGQTEALNAAFQLCSGQIICLLDSDDLQDENYIASVKDFFSHERKFDVLYTAPIPFRDTSALSRDKQTLKRIRDLSPSGIVRTCGLLCATKPYAWIGNPTSGIAMRISAAKQLFPLVVPKGWSLAADQILCQKILLKGLSVYRTNHVGFLYRVHAGNGYLCRHARSRHELIRDTVLGNARTSAGITVTRFELVSQLFRERRTIGYINLILNFLVRAPQLLFARL